MNGDRVLRIIAALTLWLAPLPAAFFVGRSVYWHLIYNWHLDLWALGIIAAIVAGGMIELVGLLSAHTALACFRWNQRGDVKRDKGARESAPFLVAAACFAVYVLVAIALAVVLEAWPDLAIYAPALIVVMAATAYVALGVYEQHRDRLARYNLQWNWKTKPSEESEPQATTSEDHSDHLRCDAPGCKQSFAWPGEYADRRAAQNALNAHRRWHHTNNGRKEPEHERQTEPR